MDSETFNERKQFLEEFYNEDRINFLSCKRYIDFTPEGKIFYNLNCATYNLKFTTDVKLIKNIHNIYDCFKIPLKNICEFIKPFLYFIYSDTAYNKPLFFTNHMLFFDYIVLNFYCGEEDRFSFRYDVSNQVRDLYKFLKNFQIQEYFKNSDVIVNTLTIKLSTEYFNIEREDYIYLGGITDEYDAYVANIESNTYLANDVYDPMDGNYRNYRNYINDTNETEEENKDEEKKKINTSQTFKSEECIICLTNPPNVLFCNCGHLCYCSTCEKLKTSNACPICKTKNEIIRILE